MALAAAAGVRTSVNVSSSAHELVPPFAIVSSPIASTALAFAAGPLGVFLVLRRLSLMGDAMAHAILPGAAVGYVRQARADRRR